MSKVVVYQESISPLQSTKLVFEGEYREANDFFLDYIKERGYSVKDVTYYPNGDKKIGSITTKDLISLQK